MTPIEILVSDLVKSHATKEAGAFGEQLKETHKIVSEEISHLRKMVHNFSSFSKLPAPQFENIALQPFITSYLDAYGSSWPNVTITFDGSSLLEPAIVALDCGLFRQVFMNLINNATEANAEVPIEIRFRLAESQSGIQIEVTNSGRVIPVALREKIFQPYFSTKSDHDHMGLGLSVVKKIVMDHGGRIACWDRGEGAGFVIELPRVDQTAGGI
ncbi:ATP-binding protein [Bdellovibrionota bacterium FG-2]